MSESRSRDFGVALLLAIVAAVLRFWQWGAVGLDHFDEGGYAMSARAVAEGAFATDRYPLQHFLSPPFVFGSAGTLMRVLGVHDWVLLGLSAALGVATVLLVWWAASRWLGRSAGFAAATLLAFADFHVLYSRSGLTDVSFGFWFLAALYCFAEAERRESWTWAGLAGLATGLAWNTKYHGWLAVIIAGVAVVATFPWNDRTRLLKGVGRVVFAGVVAFAVYTPWLLFIVSQPGGYGRLNQEHQLYLRPTRAHRQTWTHLNSQLYLDGWWGRCAPLLAALGVAAAGGAAELTRRLRRVAVVGVVGVILGSTLFAGLAAVWSLPRLLLQRDPGVRVGLAFFAAFTALTPLYYPYPRLVLPWLLSAMVLAGWSIHAFVTGDERVAAPTDGDPSRDTVPGPRPVWLRATFAVLAVVLCSIAAWRRPPWESASTYRAKDGFRTAAASLAEGLPPGGRVVVWGEPGVVFYLRDSVRDVRHVNDLLGLEALASEDVPLFLVTSLYAGRIDGDLSLDAWMEGHPGALTAVATAPVRHVSDVRLLDDFGRPRASAFRAGDDDAYDLTLYRVTLGGERP